MPRRVCGVESGEWNRRPGYRPPMAAGQQYPALGYAPDGTARLGYQPGPRGEFPSEQAAQAGGPPPEAPVDTPPPISPPPNSPLRVTLGILAVVALVLGVVGVLKLMGGDNGDDIPTRAAPPATQNTDDPYLPKSITPTETVPGESRRPVPGTGVQAQVTVEGAPGTMIVYSDAGRVRVGRLSSDRWEQTVSTSGGGLISVNAVAAAGSGASCTITVDGTVLAHEEVSAGDSSGVVVCRATA